jgi:16S rRNA (adenine1518-N6/adenine1519-N6)-dimethyltransferase
VPRAKKALGQNWLTDQAALASIAAWAELTPDDVVLEIGPGLGALTEKLLAQTGRVVAVEVDQDLLENLRQKFYSKKFESNKFELTSGDFMEFDLNSLPRDYKVAANIPYYLTSKILQKLLTAANPPLRTVLLVQKEVAERLAAGAGDYSLLALSAQIYAEVTLGEVVTADKFTPAPKVDSQVVVLSRRPRPLIDAGSEKKFFRVVKAGFSARRKKLRSSLAGGLALDKPVAENLLRGAGIDPNKRAQDLTIDDWIKLTETWLTEVEQ